MAFDATRTEPMPPASPRKFAKLRVETPPVFPGARIGLMGGTFNPPHEGHLVSAETALRRLKLDALWWMVSPGNPLKPRDGLAGLDERMAASRSITLNPAITVTGFEAALGSAYTFDTVRYLARRYPAARFVWVMGADNLATFHLWHRWRHIARLVPIAVVDRPGWHMAALASPAARFLSRQRLPDALAAKLPGSRPPAWVYLSARLSAASSTALRARSAK
jgi:nicotinate-nucleotide adenylyltransferase